MESALPATTLAGTIRGFEVGGNALHASAALDRFNQGVVIVDRTRRVHYVNSLASSICSESKMLQIRQGVLFAVEARHVRPLTQACEQAALTARETLLRLDRAEPQSTLSVLVTGLPPHSQSQCSIALAMLTLNDPQRRALPSQVRLMTFYGLTRTEAAVTQLLVAGKTLAALARVLGMSVATARTHLRGVLSKTDTHRQSELIQRVQQEAAAVL